MATLIQEEKIKDLAVKITKELQEIYGVEMAFFLSMLRFGGGEACVADYISNVSRESGIDMLKTTAERLETRQVIPASQGQG
jgi:hypothetical protein